MTVGAMARQAQGGLRGERPHQSYYPAGPARCAANWRDLCNSYRRTEIWEVSMEKFAHTLIAFAACVVVGALPATAQLSDAWIVPAAANTEGNGGTYWHTDLSIQNPQNWELPIVVQVLKSGQINTSVPTLDLDILPWETVNLWDVLGPDLFASSGTAALLVYVPQGVDCPENSCDFLVTSRTYTEDPWSANGEFGQAISGAALLEGTDWSTFGYATGILNDDDFFRCNIGVASWTGEWTMVYADIQDTAGNVIDTEVFDLPPFGHLQRRLREPVVGGTAVFYIVDGPSDAFVYPYVSVVNQATGDPSYFFARYSGVGAAAKNRSRSSVAFPARGGTVTGSTKTSRK